MRILHISPESIINEEIIGGRGVWLQNVLPVQAKEHEIRFLTFSNTKDLDDGNFKMVSCDFNSTYPAPNEIIGQFKEDNFKALSKAIEVLRIWKPDLIHCHDADLYETASQLKKLFGIPMVYTIHLSSAACFREGISRQRYQIYLCQREQDATKEADIVHVCSEVYRNKFYNGTQNLIDCWYMSDKPVRVIRNGVKNNFDKKGKGVDKKYANVFFAGRFTKGKGIETICGVIPRMPNHRFFLQVNSMELKNRESTIQRLSFCGR